MLTRTTLHAALVALLPVVAKCNTVPIFMIGIGYESCATWTPSTEHEEVAWILGFWSGLNVNNDGTGLVGSTTDAKGIVAAARAGCETDPTIPLSQVVYQIYRRLESQKR